MNNTTLRVQKNSQNPYTMVPNSVFNDKRLSAKATGIITYLLSKPDNWSCRVKDLYNNFMDGYDSIRNGLKELKICGYVEIKNSGSGDNFTGRYLSIREIPLFATGFRKIENINKNFLPEEELISTHPMFKSKGKSFHNES